MYFQNLSERVGACVFLLFQCCVSALDGEGNRREGRRGDGEPGPKLSPVPLTIDQLIVQAYGGAEAVNRMASRMSRGGLVTSELDMNLTPQQYFGLYSQDDNGRGKRKAYNDVRTRWPNGIIPYEIEHRDFNAQEVTEIKEALEQWTKMTCIRFRPAVSGDSHRVKLRNGPGCNSAVGMAYGTQVINLSSTGCRYKGLYLHETGHAIGLLHEHNLPQRDDYVRIDLSHVAPGFRSSFKVYDKKWLAHLDLDYDFSSIMHYGKTAFSYNGEAQTIYIREKNKEEKERKEDLIGSVANKALGFSDVRAVTHMYKCNAHCPKQPSCQEPCFINKDCKCFCKSDMPKVPCENMDTNCDDWADRGECNRNRDYMRAHCRKACAVCVEDESRSTQASVQEETSPLPESCVNHADDARCDAWAARGECGANPGYMLHNCQRACRHCDTAPSTSTPAGDTTFTTIVDVAATTTTTMTPTTAATQVATTPVTTATTLAITSSATTTPTTISPTAADTKAVTTTTTTSTTPTTTTTSSGVTTTPSSTVPTTVVTAETTRKSASAACGNKYGDARCQAWSGRGECARSPGFMSSNCRQACGRCPSHQGGGGGSDDAGGSCVDISSKCSSWMTYCNRNSYVTNNCRMTCGACRRHAGPMGVYKTLETAGNERRKKKNKSKGRGRGRGRGKGKNSRHRMKDSR